mgnify:CR=1 FL=1
MSETSAKSQPVRGLAKSVAADIGTRTNATIAGLLALAGVTGLAGGFEEAAPEEVVSAAESAQPEELDVSPLTVQVQRTYVLDGARVVHMRLTNTAERPIYAVQWRQAFDLEDSSLEEQPEFQKIDERRTGDEDLESLPLPDNQVLNPGVPQDIALVFSGDGDTLVVWSMEYRKSFLDGDKTWFAKERVAEVELR